MLFQPCILGVKKNDLCLSDHALVLCPVLGSPEQEAYGHVAVSVMKAPKVVSEFCTCRARERWVCLSIERE